MGQEEIVKVRRVDLENLINSNTKAHEILDQISMQATEVGEKVSEAFSRLEDASINIEDYIVEDEEFDGHESGSDPK